MVKLELKLAEKSEKKLRIYTKRAFGMSLEQKLQSVIIEWISKAREGLE